METPETLRLLHNYWHLSRVTAQKKYPQLPESEIDDLEAVGLQGLLRAARAYRPGRGASWQSLAITAIHRVMINARTKEVRRWRRETGVEAGAIRESGEAVVLSLSEPLREGDLLTIADFLPDSHDTQRTVLVRELWRRIHALPEREQAAIRAYCEGESNCAIGRALGVGRDAARTILDRALATIREQFQ